MFELYKARAKPENGLFVQGKTTKTKNHQQQVEQFRRFLKTQAYENKQRTEATQNETLRN